MPIFDCFVILSVAKIHRFRSLKYTLQISDWLEIGIISTLAEVPNEC